MPLTVLRRVGAHAALALQLGACSLPQQGWPDGSAAADTAAPPREKSGAVSGTVLDAAGAPVAGAHVLTSPHGYEATTDADGGFVVSLLPPGAYTLLAAAEGLAPGRSDPVTVSDGAEAQVTLTLQTAERLDGLVTVDVRGPLGEPIEGAVVSASSGAVAISDALGVAILDGVAGELVDLSVADADGALWPWTFQDVSVPERGGVQLAATLAGRPEPDSITIGSSYCTNSCHSDLDEAWSGSPHGRALSATIDGDLADLFLGGTTVDMGGPSAILSSPNDTPSVILIAVGGEARSYPVDGLIGDVRSGSVPYTELDGRAWPLPLAWIAPDLDRVSWPEGDGRIEPWQTDLWFTDAGDFAFADGATPEPAASAEGSCFGCHATGYTLSARGDGGFDMDPTFGDDPRWADGAVGCEACHGPGYSHAETPDSNKPYLITKPTLLQPERGQDVCAQCHSGFLSDDPAVPFAYAEGFGAFHPGQDLSDYGAPQPVTWGDGTAALPGQQVDDFKASKHGAAGLECVDCHNPHDTTTRLDYQDNSLCAACHLSLSFGDDVGTMEDHSGHRDYDPGGDSEMGRCTGCHMPRTAARKSFGALSGAGDVASHIFVASAPQVTLDAFDAASTDTMDIGTFPIHACAECHAYGTARKEAAGSSFSGPSGDPTQRATHEEFQLEYEDKFP